MIARYKVKKWRFYLKNKKKSCGKPTLFCNLKIKKGEVVKKQIEDKKAVRIHHFFVEREGKRNDKLGELFFLQ